MADKICYSNDGLSMRYVADSYTPEAGEKLFDDVPTEAQLKKAFSKHSKASSNAEIRKQIYALESQQSSPRRMREAVLGIDNGWLEGINTQIETLRNSLS